MTTPAAKKVFIKTFGCQMNEYDSAKMVDVLHAARGYEATSNVDEADLILFNTCSVREKAQEKVFSDLGRVKHLKAKGTLIGVGGCVASQEGEALVRRAPYVDIVFGPQTLHRLARTDRPATRREPPAGRHPLSGDREVRPSAAGAGRRTDGIRLDHGRVLEVLQLLRGSVHARRRGLEAARRRADRDRRSGRPGRQGSDAAGPERQRLPRTDGNERRNCRLRAAARMRRRPARHRADPLHDQSSERVHAAPRSTPMPRCRSSSAICICRCSTAATGS